jgi:hypothetical protein
MELETGVETALPVPFGEKEAAPLMLLMDKDHGTRTPGCLPSIDVRLHKGCFFAPTQLAIFATFKAPCLASGASHMPRNL